MSIIEVENKKKKKGRGGRMEEIFEKARALTEEEEKKFVEMLQKKFGFMTGIELFTMKEWRITENIVVSKDDFWYLE